VYAVIEIILCACLGESRLYRVRIGHQARFRWKQVLLGQDNINSDATPVNATEFLAGPIGYQAKPSGYEIERRVANFMYARQR